MSRRRAAGHHLLVILLLCAVVPFEPGFAAGSSQRLDLFQRIARSDLIVRVRVREGALRFAVVEIQQLFKGQPPGDTLRIAFRDFNFGRSRGAEPIVFPDGQEEILFLVPYMQVKRNDKNKDIYELFVGAEGRITVPAEGSGLVLDAIARLADIAAAEPAVQIERLRALLGSDNPHLIEAALDEIDRMMAATPDLYPRLAAMLSGVELPLKTRALRLLRFLFERERHDRKAASTPEALLDLNPQRSADALMAVQIRARNDAVAEVRRLAVLALAAWPDRGAVESDLRAIASQDVEQSVRYEAKRALVLGGTRP